MVDITGLIGLKEVVDQSQLKGVLVGGVNISMSVDAKLVKFGIALNSLEAIRSSLGTTTSPPSGKLHKDGGGLHAHVESKNTTLLSHGNSNGNGNGSDNEASNGTFNISRNNSATSVNGSIVVKRKISCEGKASNGRNKCDDENAEYKDHQSFII